ncbi:MAG: hypothetical protein LUG46_05155, partial [Erysipelotrichaceae bacterium]|nr:hypothetical protein [Erysipelotrichaceae bacterium]
YEETFEIVQTYIVKFKVNAETKTDSYLILLRSSYEYESGNQRIIRSRYRYLMISDFYKGNITSSDDVETLSSDLEVFDPVNRYPESYALETFKEGFNSDQYEFEEVKYYYNESLNEIFNKVENT